MALAFRQLAKLSEGVDVDLKLPPSEEMGGLIDGSIDRKLATAIDKAYGYIYSVSIVNDIASTRSRDV
jgi:hypothetical protein